MPNRTARLSFLFLLLALSSLAAAPAALALVELPPVRASVDRDGISAQVGPLRVTTRADPADPAASASTAEAQEAAPAGSEGASMAEAPGAQAPAPGLLAWVALAVVGALAFAALLANRRAGRARAAPAPAPAPAPQAAPKSS